MAMSARTVLHFSLKEQSTIALFQKMLCSSAYWHVHRPITSRALHAPCDQSIGILTFGELLRMISSCRYRIHASHCHVGDLTHI